MRTTLTLDDDVAVHLEKLRTRQNRTFKQVVNDVLRAGLAAVESQVREQRAAYVTRPISGGKPLHPDVDNIAEVLALTEGEDHR